jgi:hypothetical protein
MKALALWTTGANSDAVEADRWKCYPMAPGNARPILPVAATEVRAPYCDAARARGPNGR